MEIYILDSKRCFFDSLRLVHDMKHPNINTNINIINVKFKKSLVSVGNVLMI